MQDARVLHWDFPFGLSLKTIQAHHGEYRNTAPPLCLASRPILGPRRGVSFVSSAGALLVWQLHDATIIGGAPVDFDDLPGRRADASQAIVATKRLWQPLSNQVLQTPLHRADQLRRRHGRLSADEENEAGGEDSVYSPFASVSISLFSSPTFSGCLAARLFRSPTSASRS